METGGPVVGTYDGETGEIISIEPYHRFDSTPTGHTFRMFYDSKSCSTTL
jgi:hypothetical protein